MERGCADFVIYILDLINEKTTRPSTGAWIAGAGPGVSIRDNRPDLVEASRPADAGDQTPGAR